MKDRRFKLFIYILLIFIVTISGIGVYNYYTNDEILEGNILLSDDSLEILDGVYEEEVNNSSINLNNSLLSSSSIASSTDMSITINGDFVNLNYSPAGGFYYNTKNSYNSSVNITSGGGYRSGGNGYISLKNGTYYFWTYNLNNMSFIAKGPVNITKSCKNETKLNQTGKFSFQRCYIRDRNNNIKPESSGTVATCASGYKMDSSKYSRTDNCSSKTLTNNISKRYCTATFTATCVKNSTGGDSGGSSGGGTTPSVAAAKLSALSVSSGTLSPSFKSSTKSYKVTVAANVSSIKVNATAASGSSFVSGYGSRTVKLNYGSNSIKVKVKNSANKVTTYTINVTRTDNRSSTSTLSNLKVSVGTLSPAFSSNVTTYNVDVGNETTSIKIDATLTDSKSSFVSGYGPGSYSLKEGLNNINIKVKSQRGDINVYTINVNRGSTPGECTTEADDLALLKGIILSVDINDVEIDQIENFDPKVFIYNDLEVPYQVSNLTIEALTQDEEDQVLIEGASELEVNVPKEIKITVTSKKCTNVTKVYTLSVTRQPEKQLGGSGELTNIIVKGHEDEVEFSPEITSYGITLKKNETKLDIEYEKKEETANCEIQGNEDLKVGDSVEITCTSEDEEDVQKYTLAIDGVEKGTNVFFIIIVVILVILVLIYLVMRLLGYRIYFNASVIGAFFRGMGEKIKNVFDK